MLNVILFTTLLTVQLVVQKTPCTTTARLYTALSVQPTLLTSLNLAMFARLTKLFAIEGNPASEPNGPVMSRNGTLQINTQSDSSATTAQDQPLPSEPHSIGVTEDPLCDGMIEFCKEGRQHPSQTERGSTGGESAV